MYDLVVIGAGPAGSCAAFHAAAAGARVLLLDRSAFPRRKPCGDAIGPRGVAVIRRMGVGDPPWHEIAGASIHAGSLPAHVERCVDHVAPGFGAVCRRDVFDPWLVDRACEAGVEFETAHVTGLTTDSDGVVDGVRIARGGAADSRIEARQVLVATGAGVPRFAAPFLDYQRAPRFGVALRGYADAQVSEHDLLDMRLPLEDQAGALPGYGWIFPMGGGRVNLGVGLVRMPRSKSFSLRSSLEQFAERELSVPFDAIDTLESAPLMFGAMRSTKGGLVVAGDVAGYCNAFSGEGIAAALESGETVGRMVGRCAEEIAAKLSSVFERAARVDPLAEDIHAGASFSLSRGLDVFVSPARYAGRAMRRVTWDLPRTAPAWQTGIRPAAMRAIESHRASILSALARHSASASVLLSEWFDDRRSGFGLATAAGAALCEDCGADPARLECREMCVLEVARLLAGLHADLAVVRGRPSEKTYGCDSFALVTIDALTAAVMGWVAEMDTDTARRLVGVLRRGALGLIDGAAGAAAHGEGWRAVAEIVHAPVEVAALSRFAVGERDPEYPALSRLGARVWGTSADAAELSVQGFEFGTPGRDEDVGLPRGPRAVAEGRSKCGF